MTFKTEQEAFWAGDFGNEYMARNTGERLIASNISLFSNALQKISKIKSCIEFGANIGLNLHALRLIFPDVDFHAIEINEAAAKQLNSHPANPVVHNESILDFKIERQWDLVVIKGVLIHIEPESLNIVYDKLVHACDKYIFISEYYNPKPVMIDYRGHSDRLYKRDFAGELLDRHSNLRIVDYGFVYHRDNNFPQDDTNWFLLEKISNER